MRKITNKKILIAVILVTIVSIYPNIAHAAGNEFIDQINNWLSLMYDTVSVTAGIIIYLMSWAIRIGFTYSAQFIPPSLLSYWVIIRDFVNLFYILIIVVMAFGTIFNIQKYTYREMLAPLLISALLINFSWSITRYGLDISDKLSIMVLNILSDHDPRGEGSQILTETMAEGFGIKKVYDQGGVVGLGGRGLEAIAFFQYAGFEYGVGMIVFTFANILLILGALIAFLCLGIFLLFRIPMIWFALITAPIAWIGYAIPNIREQTWGKWWKSYTKWVFFPPIYLTILMGAVLIINAKGLFFSQASLA